MIYVDSWLMINPNMIHEFAKHPQKPRTRHQPPGVGLLISHCEDMGFPWPWGHPKTQRMVSVRESNFQ